MSDSEYYETFEIKCPVCMSENTTAIQKEVNIPYFSNILLFSLICNDCKYKTTDFLNTSIKEPTRYIYKTDTEKDYSTKIVRGANGTIRFPEIGSMIEPGPNAEGFINNIEGVLRDIEGKARFLLNDAQTEKERRKILDFIQSINNYINNNEPITIIVEDPFGNSLIIPYDPNKLEVITLSKEEAKNLKTSFSIIDMEK